MKKQIAIYTAIFTALVFLLIVIFDIYFSKNFDWILMALFILLLTALNFKKHPTYKTIAWAVIFTCLLCLLFCVAMLFVFVKVAATI